MNCAENLRQLTPLTCLLLACLVSQPAASRVCDVDDDGDIDRADLRLIFRAQNSSMPQGDPRDADGDGFATERDIRRCEKMCALPLCADSQANEPPSIISAPTIYTAGAELYSYDVRARDLDPEDTLVYSLDVAPRGMTIDAQNGRIQWLPAASQLGAHPVEVRVVDNQGGIAAQLYTIHVGSPIRVADQQRGAASSLTTDAAW